MIEVRWSPAVICDLEELANRCRAGRHPIEAELSSAMLLAAAGTTKQAENRVLQAVGASDSWADMHHQAFVSLIIALFVVQRLDIVSRMLTARYNFGGEVMLSFVQSQSHPIAIGWEIGSNGASHFSFNSTLLQNDGTQNQVLAFLRTISLFEQYTKSERVEQGSLMVNLGDIGYVPGVAFCDNRPEYFLVPDNLFIASRGYEAVRLAMGQRDVPWHDRREVALWRGSTTGHPSDRSVGWRSLPRLILCEFGRRHQDLIDAGVTRAVQVEAPDEVEAEIKAAGHWRGFVPATEFNHFKYQIDIDGNTNSWPGLFQKLLTGSTVLKVESPYGYRQWYYGRLQPWHNYVPVSCDMSDLVEKIRWLREHDEVAQQIGRAGKVLAEAATIERELEGAVSTIAAALRHSRSEAAAKNS
jgi:hypothetical protein